MGTTLIFVGLLGDDEGRNPFPVNGYPGAAQDFQEIAPAYRPYPKPTQVGW